MRLWEIIKMADEGQLKIGDKFKAINTPCNLIIEYEDSELVYNTIMSNTTTRNAVTLCGEMTTEFERFETIEICTYCDEQNIEISENAFQGSDGILYNKRNEKYYLVIEHFQGEISKVGIEFCPQCGRKLA